MGGRFPNVDWYCDECDDSLNDQAGFDDDCETWTCAECGHENSIDTDAIIPESVMDEALAFLRSFDPKDFGR